MSEPAQHRNPFGKKQRKGNKGYREGNKGNES